MRTKAIDKMKRFGGNQVWTCLGSRSRSANGDSVKTRGEKLWKKIKNVVRAVKKNVLRKGQDDGDANSSDSTPWDSVKDRKPVMRFTLGELEEEIERQEKDSLIVDVSSAVSLISAN